MWKKAVPVAGIVLLVLASLPQRAAADAKDDCKIEFQMGINGEEAYVHNTNTGKKVRVTVAVTENNPTGSRKLPDKVLDLAAGQRAFLGGTKAFANKYTFTIAGASYE